MAPAVQSSEFQFAQRLASSEKDIRDRAARKLRQYLSARTQSDTGTGLGPRRCVRRGSRLRLLRAVRRSSWPCVPAHHWPSSLRLVCVSLCLPGMYTGVVEKCRKKSL